jgi:glycerol-1-phosphate dehydrogenase [NAD(P)+]
MSGADLIRDAVARSANVAEVMIGRGVLAEAGALYGRHFAGPVVLMADDRGWGAAGRSSRSSPGGRGHRLAPPCHPGRPAPETDG